MNQRLTSLFIFLAISILGYSQTRVTGTNIFLEIPNGFELDSNVLNTYYNYKREYITARIIKNDYNLIKSTANWEFYKDRGDNKLVKEDTFSISGFKGQYFECIMNKETRSYQITVGDSTTTYQIFASCYNNSSLLQEQLSAMLHSIKIDTSFNVPWNDELGFKFDSEEPFAKKDAQHNTISIYPESGMRVDLVRVIDIPGRKESSESLLTKYGKIGWDKRQDFIVESALKTQQTVINKQQTTLLKTYCKEVSKETLLIEAVIEGPTQRLFVFCKIQKDFESNEEKLLSFLNKIEVD